LADDSTHGQTNCQKVQKLRKGEEQNQSEDEENVTGDLSALYHY